MHLANWTTFTSVAPSTRQYLTYPVPTQKNEKWSPLPLETLDEAEERAEELALGAASILRPSTLAAIRAEHHPKRQHEEIDEKSVVEVIRTTHFQAPHIRAQGRPTAKHYTRLPSK
jgi:hypothetical protein